MKKLTFLSLFLLFCLNVNAQPKFGARSGVGVYFNLFYANVLGSNSNSSNPQISLLGNPIPRAKDEENHKIYTDFGFSQEVFAKWRDKNEISFSFTYIKEPRAYDDIAELYWGQNEDNKEIYYQLVYSRKYFENEKFSLQVGLGLAVNKQYISRASYRASQNQNRDIVLSNFNYYTIGNDPKQFDWGFPLKLQINYNISDKAAVGLQSNIIYLFQLGINHVTLTPTLQISF